MKKISLVFALLLCVSLILAAGTPTNAASTDFLFTTNDLPASLKANEQFVLQLSVSTTANISGYALDVVFDTSAVSVTSKENLVDGYSFPQMQECFGDFLIDAPTEFDIIKTSASTYRITAVNAKSIKNYSGGGTIAVFSCKAVRDLSSAELLQAITVTPNADNCLKWSNSKVVSASYSVEFTIKKADLTELNTAIDNAEKKNRDDYSISSYTNLKNALIAAKSLSGTIYGDRQNEVDTLADDLNTALANLKPTYTTALGEAVAQAEKLEKKMYSVSSYAAVSEALITAKAELTNAASYSTTDKKLSDATTALTNAIKNLEESEYKKLSDLVTKYSGSGYVADDFTEASFSVFSTELKDAKALLNSTKATEDDFAAQVTDLKSAASGLRYLLREKIETAETYLDKEKYSTATLATLQKAITKAKNLLDGSSTKATRKEQVDALQKAIDGLKQSPRITLRAVMEQAKTLNGADYTLSTYETLTKALEKATSRLNDNAEDSYLEKSITAINDAIAGLRESPRITLTKAVTDAEAYEEQDYSKATFAVLADALENAKNLLGDTASSEADMTACITDIRNAVEKLAPKPTGTLKQLLKTVPQEEEYYSAETYSVLKIAVTQAQTLLAEEDPDEASIDSVITDIQSALEGLESRLPSVIADALLVDSTIYTTDSYALLAQAITQANTLTDDETASLLDKHNAALAIESATSSLQFNEREKLRRLVTELQNKDTSEMSNQSAAEFNEAFDNALAVLNNENATDEDLLFANRDLTNKNDALVVSIRPDVRQAITDAKKYKSDGYTEDSLAALTECIEAAEAVLSDANATEKEYQTAIDNIRDAVEDLEKESDDKENLFSNPDFRVFLYVIVTMAVIILVEFVIISVLLHKVADKRRE